MKKKREREREKTRSSAPLLEVLQFWVLAQRLLQPRGTIDAVVVFLRLCIATGKVRATTAAMTTATAMIGSPQTESVPQRLGGVVSP